MKISRSYAKNKSITNPADIANVFQGVLNAEPIHDREKEHFWVIGLTTRNVIKHIELVSLGTVQASLVHPREVFRLAIMDGVTSIILAHNHPSESIEPSDEDLKITRRLIEAGKIIGIEVLDHVIITINSYSSLKQRGII